MAKIIIVRRLILLTAFFGAASFCFGQTAPSKEYQVKAVFLFNFAQFVDWPPEAFTSVDAPFVIGVLGKDPFGTYLDETVRGEKINGHPFVVKRFQHVSEAGECHILFINPTKGDQLKGVLNHLKVSSVLTVGDAANFTKQGGIVGFFKESNKIRIRINVDAAKNAELEVSSKLLRVAEIVSSEND